MNSLYFTFSWCCLGLALTIELPFSDQNENEKELSATEYKIQNSQSKKMIGLPKLVDSLSSSDVIFLGEQHDNDSGHRFQLQFIQSFVEAGHSVSISLEQFEKDVQGALNDYLAGKLTEDEFLQASRPWKNYTRHYRPIVEYARKKQIPVIASNLPRRVAATVSKGQQVAIEDKCWLPRQTFTERNDYWDRFKATMSGHIGTEGESKLENYFNSQCSKDDAMAESITDYLQINSHKRKTVIHLCGHFHSDYGLGTVSRVLRRSPLTKISVVTMESIENMDDKEVQNSVGSRSHFAIWTVRNQKTVAAVDSKVKQQVGK